jgi:ribosomal protein S6--L-glutamate ligase
MRLGFIAERRYRRQAITKAVVRTLQEQAVVVDVICSQDCRFEPESGIVQAESEPERSLRSYDALISRSRNALGLAMLAYAQAAGIPTINSYRAIQRARNKAEVALELSLAGVPCAPTILADRAEVLADLPSWWFPLILKATFGDAGHGLRVVRQPEELSDLHWGGELALAQHYVSNDGFDLKLYVCGGRVFAMRKPSPLNSDRDAAGVPIQPDVAMRDIALRCGTVLGLDIYGVDAIATPDGPLVIEVNEFPNFTHVLGAGQAISEFILARVGAGLDLPDGPPRLIRAPTTQRMETRGVTRADRVPGASV